MTTSMRFWCLAARAKWKANHEQFLEDGEVSPWTIAIRFKTSRSKGNDEVWRQFLAEENPRGGGLVIVTLKRP